MPLDLKVAIVNNTGELFQPKVQPFGLFAKTKNPLQWLPKGPAPLFN